ncbi:MAG: BamA/TamA family outer membrane protein [Rhodothermales bacterium]|nr:BamA/TamA family outer membrane protein [Rhodothermales bacterium]
MPAVIWKFVVLMGALAVLGAAPAAAQAPLFLADDETTVRGIAFKFADGQAFEEDQLQNQIVTQEPGFMARLRKILPFLEPPTFPLDPVELQKDVVRLRRFYAQNGFPEAWITYGASQLDTARNSIRVIFSVTQGRPLIIQDVVFYQPGGDYAASLFEGEMRDRWIRFRDRTSFRTGDRYTEFDRLRIQDQVLTWLTDRGYAFARFDSVNVQIDSTAFTADIGFYINPGPRGRFDEILVEGNEHVSRNVVVRELPFKEGDRFSQSKLIEGQRELFALNLFRLALADIPPTEEAVVEQDTLDFFNDDLRQPRDSTVVVRYRVREARLRYLTAQTGYARELGATVQGQWTHRNFLGGARNLTVSSVINSGLLASPPAETIERRLFLGEVSLRQPYLFSTDLSGILRPFIRYERDPLLEDSDEAFQVNRREVGASATLLYELLPFRTVSLRSTISRVDQFVSDLRLGADSTQLGDAYSKSVLALNATLGRVNDFINPRRGFLVRPYLEEAGLLLRSDVEYVKAGSEVVGYLPLTRQVQLGLRVSGGRLWALGQSKGKTESDVLIENRFDPVRLYAGGLDDVRGWASQLLGPKRPRELTVRRSREGPDTTEVIGHFYEPIGGLAKLAANVELRLPFPGLNDKWRTAVFLDLGQVSAERVQQPTTTPAGEPAVEFVVEDRGALRLNPSAFQYGAGAGIRYETPVGFIRFDIAYKLNPRAIDLQPADDRFDYEQALRLGDLDAPPPDERFRRRFDFHLSLGQAF